VVATSSLWPRRKAPFYYLVIPAHLLGYILISEIYFGLDLDKRWLMKSFLLGLSVE
jgi:hypothetical protein